MEAILYHVFAADILEKLNIWPEFMPESAPVKAPFTVSLLLGFVVPMPTFPSFDIQS
jgi:hypothetical protein